MKQKTKTKRKPLNKGLFWHCHHQDVVEFVWSAYERRNYIMRDKDHTEIPLRLALFQPVTTKRATGRVKKFILFARKAQNEVELDKEAHRLGFKPAFDYSRCYYWGALREVAQLHKYQCHPGRCPVTRKKFDIESMRNVNIFTRENRGGIYTMRNQKK